MVVEDIYPYWGDLHEELLETLEYIPAVVWTLKPTEDARTLRQMVMHMIDRERFLIGHIAQGMPWEPPHPSDYKTPELLIEGLQVTRATTRRYIESLLPVTLKAVRTLPPDAENNIPETNRPISWILWQVVQHEIYHWGQIQLIRQLAAG